MAPVTRAPVFIRLMWIAVVAMLLPMAMALIERDFATSRGFFYGALICALFSLLLDLTLRRPVRRAHAGELLVSMIAAYALLPLMLAVPMVMAMGGTMADAWFEMLSSITTTGATLLDQGQYVPRAVHLWRALTGWAGGLFTLITAVALLAPLNLGGFEVRAPRDPRAVLRSFSERNAGDDPVELLWTHTKAIAPIYMALTGLLFVGLMIAGDDEFVALCHAMAVLSTSGISPVGGVTGAHSGYLGEAVILLFFLFAFARSAYGPTILGDRKVWAWRDPEMHLALLILGLGTALLYLRHWFGGDTEHATMAQGVQAFWGTLFTGASFLSTTGFESNGWFLAGFWSGLKVPGLALLGFAMIGGGVATTAGGVKLMRVFALWQHLKREAELLVMPNSVGGKGVHGRRIRQQGAYIAWLLFMLFAMSLAVIMCALALTGVQFENAMALAVAALSNCGPLAAVATQTPVSFTQVGGVAQIILGAAMVAGRIEALALIAVLNSDLWRK